MRVAIVENTSITHHGQVGVALHEAAAVIDLWKPWSGQALPAAPEADALIVFGGEQAATDDHTHPYLPDLAPPPAANTQPCNQNLLGAESTVKIPWNIN